MKKTANVRTPALLQRLANIRARDLFERLANLRKPALLVPLAIVVLVWLAAGLGALARPSGWLYDAFTAHPLTLSRPDPAVLLIEIPADEDPAAPRDWAPLVAQLREFGAAQVIFSVTPRGADALFTLARESGRIVFGRRLLASNDDPEFLFEETLPDGATPAGISAPPAAADGIHRRQAVSHLPALGDPLPYLEVVAAAQRVGADFKAPRRPYRVNFLAGPGYLPRIGAPAALGGRLIPELVAGRSVLIGPQGGGYHGGVHSPLSGISRPLTVLEFQGYALDTLIADRVIKDTPGWITLLWLIAAAAASVIAYQWLSLRVAAIATAAVLAGYFVLAWVVLGLAEIWLPAVDLALAQFALFVGIFAHRKTMQDRALRQLLLHVSSRVKERATPVGFIAARDPWAEVIGMVNQALDLKRTIFLERVEGDHRVREIAAHNCSIKDVNEMRRDFERFPYTAALAAKGPINVAERIYLKPLETPEEQFLTPLVFAGEVQGFWALGVEPGALEATPAFLNIVRNFSDQIAELIYHRRQAHRQSARDASRVQQTLALESPEEAHRDLARTHALLERRLDTIESIADTLGSAFVLYDMFGNILQINAPMEQWARDAGLHIFDMSAVQFADALTRQTPGRSRAYVRHVLVDRKTVTLPVTLPTQPDRLYILNIRAVAPPQTTQAPASAPFQLLGILFEIADASHVARLYRRREQLTQHVAARMKADLAEVHAAIGRLRPEWETGGDGAWHDIEVGLAHLRQLVDAAERFFGADALSYDATSFPIDPRPAIEEALRRASVDLGKRHLALETAIAPLQHLALAEAESLRDSLTGLLAILIDDAIENSTLRVALHEETIDGKAWVLITLRNSGFGMPAERLASLLAESADAKQAHPFKTAKDHVEYWGGQFEAETGIGRGLAVTLALRGFSADTEQPPAAADAAPPIDPAAPTAAGALSSAPGSSDPGTTPA